MMQLRTSLAIAGLVLLGAMPSHVVNALAPVGVRQNRQRPAQLPTGAFTVDGNVALSSFISLTNGHLQKLSDSLQAVATTEAAR